MFFTDKMPVPPEGEIERMDYKFTGIFEKGEKYYIGYCVEIPEANGQGETIEECRKSLSEAIKLVIKDRKNDIIASLPKDAVKEEIIIG